MTPEPGPTFPGAAACPVKEDEDMTRLSTAAAAALIALTAGAAAAMAQTGFYVTGSAGLAMPRDAGIKNENDAATNTVIHAGGSLEDLDRSPVFGFGAA
jgi:hypothetical protein